MSEPRSVIRVGRIVVLAMLTVLWCGVLYVEAVIWSDYLVNYRGLIDFGTVAVFSVAQVLYGLLGTATCIPFWIVANERDEVRS